MAEQVLDRITVAIPSTQNVKNATDHFTVSTNNNNYFAQ